MSDRPIIKIAPVDLPSDMNIEERLVSLNDQVAALTAAPTTTSLSRIPSPQITSGLTSNGAGVQFTFSQLSLSGIDGYRVYRNSSNSFAGATQLQYLKHSALFTTSVTVSDTIPAGTAEYYWVTAVGTNGLESAPTAAQAGAVASGSVVDASGAIGATNGITAATLTLSTSGAGIAVVGASAGAGTITVPSATDTLVGKATTDTLTNKTLSSPAITNPVIGGGTTLARYARYTPAISPASVAANTTAEQVFTSVLTAGDIVVGVSKPTAQAGLGVVGWRASGTALCITFSNNTAAPITPTAAETYQVVAVQ